MTAEEHCVEGRSHAERGDVAAAFVHLEKSIELEPENAEACKLLARLSLAVNEVRAFQNWCHEAARLAPDDPEPHWLIAQVYAASKRWAVGGGIGSRDEAAAAGRCAAGNVVAGRERIASAGDF